MSKDLNPCPFCGSENLSLETMGFVQRDDYLCWVKCHDCGAEGLNSKTKAVEAWNRVSDAVRKNEIEKEAKPLPCARDEHGEIKEQSVKQLLGKVNEELDELKEALILYGNDKRSVFIFPEEVLQRERERIAEEAADTITAITTMLEALGVNESMRDEAQRRVNQKNRKRGRLFPTEAAED